MGVPLDFFPLSPLLWQHSLLKTHHLFPMKSVLHVLEKKDRSKPSIPARQIHLCFLHHTKQTIATVLQPSCILYHWWLPALLHVGWLCPAINLSPKPEPWKALLAPPLLPTPISCKPVYFIPFLTFHMKRTSRQIFIPCSAQKVRLIMVMLCMSSSLAMSLHLRNLNISKSYRREWWPTPVVPVLGRPWQEDRSWRVKFSCLQFAYLVHRENACHLYHLAVV